MKTCDVRRNGKRLLVMLRRAMAPVLFALFAPMLAAPANAQSCTQLPQRVTDSTGSSNSLTGWTTASGDGNGSSWTAGGLGFNAAQHWDDQGGVSPSLPTGFDTMTQTVNRVSGGAILQFDLAWNNAQYGAAPNVYDGNQSRLVIRYAGVDYFEALTATFTNRPNTSANDVDAGPTTNASVGALGTATLLAGSLPAPFRAADGAAPNWVTITLRLPDNIAQTGALVIAVQRTQNGEPQGRTDDFYIRNITLASRTLCLLKQTPTSTTGGNFSFTTTNLDTNYTTSQSTAGGPYDNGPLTMNTTGTTAVVMPDPDTGTTGTQPALVMANTVTVTETIGTTGFALTSATCNNGVTTSLSGNQATLSNINATTSAGLMVTCTLTNQRPRIRLQKTLPGGRVLAGDQFTLNIAGPRGGSGTTASVTTTGSGSTATGVADFNPADAGGSYTLSETAAGTTVLAGYATTYSCTNATAGSTTVMPSGTGTSFNLVPAAADDITCTFSNTARLSNLAITKTNTPASGPNDQAGDTVTRGAAVTYSIIVSNGGPQASNGAVLRDPTPTGVTCTAVACSVTSGGATCPAPASLTVANLQSAGGVAIPTMPANSSLTFSLTCTAN